MNILSITFHVEQKIIPLWKDFINQGVIKLTKNISAKTKYILSKISNIPLGEGENYNIILIFEDQISRNTFGSERLPKLSKIIQDKFPDQEVMIFITDLDVISHNF